MNVVEVVILDYNRGSKKRVHRDDRLNSWLTWSEDYRHIVEVRWWVDALWTLQLFQKTRQSCSTEKQLDRSELLLVFRLENPKLRKFSNSPNVFSWLLQQNPSQFTQDWLEMLIREEFSTCGWRILNTTMCWESHLAFSPALVEVTTSSHLRSLLATKMLKLINVLGWFLSDWHIMYIYTYIYNHNMPRSMFLVISVAILVLHNAGKVNVYKDPPKMR